MKLSKMSLATDSSDFYTLGASACGNPALSFYMAYHLVAELLLFPIASTLL
ncbi:unnamed protein product [Staurois parvus]|uniref:Uncharacterized protein n=1 Tax=Staurois parvus TaxID=386267 RepID=A0ABN9GFW7_9NEOB|nr:unnamed protein product [Staurois parvus]